MSARVPRVQPSTIRHFNSQLSEIGTLIYSDDFDREYNRERWGASKKDRQIKDGKLVVTAQFRSKEVAIKVLKRDHHPELEPVVRLDRILKAYVCYLRYGINAAGLQSLAIQVDYHHRLLVCRQPFRLERAGLRKPQRFRS